MPELTSAERRALRARAHSLDPVVLIGDQGLTASVLAEAERALDAHELIKIRVAGAEREEREAMLSTVCELTGAAAVQHIGKILVIYRENPEKGRETPTEKPRSGTRTRKAGTGKPPPGARKTAKPARSARNRARSARNAPSSRPGRTSKTSRSAATAKGPRPTRRTRPTK